MAFVGVCDTDDERIEILDFFLEKELYNYFFCYAKVKQLDLSANADFSKYTDNGMISEYAAQAMSWANAKGLINGTVSMMLNPMSGATRVQATAIMHRFCETVR